MKKNTNLVEKLIITVILLLGMLLCVDWWLGGFEKPEKKEIEVISVVKEIGSKGLDEVRDTIGKEKSSHKGKIYTYVDSYAEYDILIEDKVESVVVEFNKDINQEAVLEKMGIVLESELIKEERTSRGEIRFKVYSVGNMSELEFMVDQISGNVKIMKIRY